MSNNEITYVTGDETTIDDIHELWNELNQLHLEKSIDGVGEIDSIYIKPDYRSQHIGDMLMEQSLDWIKINGPEKIIFS